jgi:hypothetical protein
MEQGVVYLRNGVDVFVYGIVQVVHGIVISHLQNTD